MFVKDYKNINILVIRACDPLKYNVYDGQSHPYCIMHQCGAMGTFISI